MVTVKDLQSRPNAPLVHYEQVASNGRSYSFWVDNSIFTANCPCNKCGASEPLCVVLTFMDDNMTCFECDNHWQDRTIEGWC